MEKKSATQREFKDTVDVIDNVYLEFNELIEIIRKCGLMVKNGKISENKNPELTKFLFDDKSYNFKRIYDSSGHRYGDGGEYGSYHFLQKNGEDVLVSMHFVTYATYSDDSADFPGRDVRKTCLLKEDDLARQVFEEIMRLSVKKGN